MALSKFDYWIKGDEMIEKSLRKKSMTTDWITKHYGQIVGYKITGMAIDDSDNSSEPWIGLVLEKGHQKKLAWILMDPEGNGVGHLDIVEEK